MFLIFTKYLFNSNMKLAVHINNLTNDVFCSNIDVKVYFHSRNQFLDLSGRMGHKIYLGKQYEAQVTTQDILQIDYKNVDNGIILYESDRKCSFEDYDQCMYRTLVTTMKKETEDNCIAPWVLHPEFEDNSTSPLVLHSENICSKPVDMNKTFWISWNRITNQKGDCLKPCNTTLINIGGKNEIDHKDKTTGRLFAYFSANVVQSQERYYITILKLAGQIGGYIGLFRLSIFLLGLMKFNTLIEGVFQTCEECEPKIDKDVQAGDTETFNEPDGSDPTIGLSTLAITNIR